MIVAGSGYSDPRVPQPNLELINMILSVDDDAGLPLDSAIPSFTRRFFVCKWGKLNIFWGIRPPRRLMTNGALIFNPSLREAVKNVLADFFR